MGMGRVFAIALRRSLVRVGVNGWKSRRDDTPIGRAREVENKPTKKRHGKKNELFVWHRGRCTLICIIIAIITRNVRVLTSELILRHYPQNIFFAVNSRYIVGSSESTKTTTETSSNESHFNQHSSLAARRLTGLSSRQKISYFYTRLHRFNVCECGAHHCRRQWTTIITLLKTTI